LYNASCFLKLLNLKDYTSEVSIKLILECH
jgi:hypothetical protein